MKTIKNKQLQFRYAGKDYRLLVSSIGDTRMLIVNNMLVDYTHFWLVLQNGTWQLVADMPVCPPLRIKLLRRIARLHGLPVDQTCPEQTTLQSGILLRAVRQVLMTPKTRIDG